MEEAWRDGRLCLLGSLAELFEIKCFYFHLRSECAADDERVKRHIQRLRIRSLQTAARVRHCSVLGPLLVKMRQGTKGRAGVGQKTIEKLEALGLQNLAQIARLSPADFKSAGITSAIPSASGPTSAAASHEFATPRNYRLWLPRSHDAWKRCPLTSLTRQV